MYSIILMTFALIFVGNFHKNCIKLCSFTLSHYWMLTGGRYSDFEKGCIRKTLFFKMIVAAAAKFYMTSNFSSRVSQSVISVILVLMLNQAPIHNSQDNLWSVGRGQTQFWLLQWHRNYTQKDFFCSTQMLGFLLIAIF